MNSRLSGCRMAVVLFVYIPFPMLQFSTFEPLMPLAAPVAAGVSLGADF
jgi:hypothetical protein